MPKRQTQSLEIARETLRRLASRRVVPTPENYRAIYHSIAGTQLEDPFPAEQFKQLATELPRETTQQRLLASQFDTAVAEKDWTALQRTIHALFSPGPTPSAPAQVPTQQDSTHVSSTSFTGWLACLLRDGVLPLVEDTPELAAEATRLADAAEALADNPASGEFPDHLRRLSNQLACNASEQRAVRESLLKLLQLIVQNIHELLIDDSWMRGQLSILSQVFENPLDLRVLDEAERRLRLVIEQQGQLTRRMTEAQERLKRMLTGFVDRLAGLSDATGRYQEVLYECTAAINRAENISELSGVIEKMLVETRSVQESAQRSGDELNTLRAEVDSANRMIAHLQRELDETSERVRHDPLTGVLSRKGLDDALAREIDIARRLGGELCLAVLDIDNFKQLNDTFGHKTGDDALKHLTRVISSVLREHDQIGRLGGEEFVVILPATGESQGAQVITRLQRELTRQFFLTGNKRVLITFSAGLTCLREGEDVLATIDRADRAMYSAKRAGKNRVNVAA